MATGPLHRVKWEHSFNFITQAFVFLLFNLFYEPEPGQKPKQCKPAVLLLHTNLGQDQNNQQPFNNGTPEVKGTEFSGHEPTRAEADVKLKTPILLHIRGMHLNQKICISLQLEQFSLTGKPPNS